VVACHAPPHWFLLLQLQTKIRLFDVSYAITRSDDLVHDLTDSCYAVFCQLHDIADSVTVIYLASLLPISTKPSYSSAEVFLSRRVFSLRYLPKWDWSRVNPYGNLGDCSPPWFVAS